MGLLQAGRGPQGSMQAKERTEEAVPDELEERRSEGGIRDVWEEDRARGAGAKPAPALGRGEAESISVQRQANKRQTHSYTWHCILVRTASGVSHRNDSIITCLLMR